MAKVSLACPVDGCSRRFEFKTGNAQLFGFVDDRDHGCMTVTIVGDQGAVSEHMRDKHPPGGARHAAARLRDTRIP